MIVMLIFVDFLKFLKNLVYRCKENKPKEDRQIYNITHKSIRLLHKFEILNMELTSII